MGAYLVGSQPSKKLIDRYVEAIKNSSSQVSHKDQKLLTYLVRNPWSIGIIDAALPFYRPHSEVRRRIYVMLAILEASPSYTEKFLPVQRNPLYFFYIAWVGFKAAVKMLVGSVWVRLVIR